MLILAPLKTLLTSNVIQMDFHKLVIAIGGPPNSIAETKLWKSIRVSHLDLVETTLEKF